MDSPIDHRSGHCKRFSFRLFAAQRYAYSRYYAGVRFPRERRLVRWLAALATPILPILLTLRLLLVVRRKAPIAKPSLLAIPYLFVFFIIWAFGECVGYLNGPGSSLQAIE